MPALTTSFSNPLCIIQTPPIDSTILIESLLRLQQVAIQQHVGERNALMLQQLRMVVDQTIQRHLDGPGLRESLRIFQRGLIPNVVDIEKVEALGDLQLVRGEVSGTIEPRLAVLRSGSDNQNVAFPRSVGL